VSDSASNSEIPAKKRGRGGARKGAGRPVDFHPSDEQRALVKLHVAMGTSYERICTAIINPVTKNPIDRGTFAKKFKREIEIAQVEMDTVATQSLMQQMRSKSLGAVIWYQKNRMGWTDSPAEVNMKVDPAGSTVVHKIEVIGGLPAGSTPENPGGDAAKAEAAEMAAELEAKAKG